MKMVIVRVFGSLGFMAVLSGCTQVSNLMNPFYESPSELAMQGERNDKAISGEREKVDEARQAMQAMASYNRSHTPQPVNPVVQPSVVRLLWIPDHLNKHGDLVPAHYYYLKVLSDRWAVQDAFELESQLHGPSGSTSNMPYIYANEKIE